MITGQYPHIVGVPGNDLVLDRSFPTLADRLNKAGYRTAFFGKWHLGGEGKPEWQPKVDGGFQFTKFMFNRGHWKKFVLEGGKPAVGAMRNGQPTYEVTGADSKTFSTDWLTDRAIEYVTDLKSKKPFFAVLSYPDPHGPNTVRPPYDHRFDNLPFAAPRTYSSGIRAPKWLGGAKNHPKFRGEEMSRYFGMVQCIDDNIGRLLARIKEADRLDNTLVIMTSDHGDLCYEHDRQNKGNPYEGSARVPMIFRFPKRIKAGEVYAQPIGTVDLTPTIMGLLNLPQNLDDRGRNLAQALADASKVSHNEKQHPVIFLRNAGKSAQWVAAVDARYKLILSVNDVPWLFDAQKDPDELQNYYGKPETREVSKRLGKALKEYGILNKDPYIEHPTIAASLAEVLGELGPKKGNSLEPPSR